MPQKYNKIIKKQKKLKYEKILYLPQLWDIKLIINKVNIYQFIK